MVGLEKVKKHNPKLDFFNMLIFRINHVIRIIVMHIMVCKKKMLKYNI
jgi:hypothetical protein